MTPAGDRDLYRARDGDLRQPADGRPSTSISMLVVGSHLWHGVSSALPVARRRSPDVDAAALVAGKVLAVVHRRRVHRRSPSGRTSSERGRERHHPRRQGPVRPDRREVGPAQVRDEAGQPGQQAEVHDHLRRHRAGRRVGGRVARRAGLQRPELLHPGQPPPRAQHRRAGRHQRREELPERRRQHLSPLLRHGQGRRLPVARSQRLPAGAAERRTSSTSASRRACRSRASTAACSTTDRSAARRCRARSTRAARPASSCCSAPISR